MAVTNYQPVAHNIPEEGRPELCCGPDFVSHVMYEYRVCVCVYTYVCMCVCVYICMCLLLRDATIMKNIFSCVLSVVFTGPKYSLINLIHSLSITLDLQWHSWLSHYAANRKVAGSIPVGVIEIFLWLNPSSSTVLVGSTHPLNRNECQECFLGVRRALMLTTFLRWFSSNLTASATWNPTGLSTHVQGLLLLFLLCVVAVKCIKCACIVELGCPSLPTLQRLVLGFWWNLALRVVY